MMGRASDAVQSPLSRRAFLDAMAPDLSKRGAIRSVFDGRYQFSRYFAPTQHNRPTSIEGLWTPRSERTSARCSPGASTVDGRSRRKTWTREAASWNYA